MPIPLKRSKLIDFSLAKSNPRLSLALSAKSLGLPENDATVFFSKDLRGITNRTVYMFSRSDRSHRYNISGYDIVVLHL